MYIVGLFRKAIMVKGYKLLGVGLKWVRPLSTDLYLFNYHKVSLRDPLKSMLNCLSSAYMWYGPSISLNSLSTTRRIVKSRRGLSTVPAGTPLVFFRRDSLSPVQLTTSVLQSLIFETRWTLYTYAQTVLQILQKKSLTQKIKGEVKTN